ncbi:beta-galactosidase [Halorarum halophilum]|uniref:beta-galactosidase n=1 Tax=Halorarum halophilum TaxID=2743090 RepID=A0A7D5GH82_9EURY|nr:beta-galactosidase [Halobaculum halophilum]QLG29010.1 beta-galactosidase [Halobaculum halophilum]
MSIGVCYFPEHWPGERWERDVEQMAEAGFEHVRMGEFAWDRLEPERGRFEFGWLDEILDLLAEHDLTAVLCTPTATPPKWLVDERPGILQETADGTVRGFGGRRHYCFNSPAYREETERVVSELADRYAGDPRVAGWQIDNEFGCHDTVRCYCDDCAAAFRDWLRERHDDVDALNEAWGTAFWSQSYPSFGSVDPPCVATADHHPSRLLAYYRFASDSVLDYNRLQVALLRDADDDWFFTHNFMGNFGDLDARAVAEDLDFASWDTYPTGGFARGGDASLRTGAFDTVGMNHDLYRGMSDERFWVTELQSGEKDYPADSPQPAEGAMRLWAHQAVAHGAGAALYFRWRRCRSGQEQYLAGLRKHHGGPDRAYGDARETAADLADLDPGPVDAPVALLHDYEDAWALDIQPRSSSFDYWAHARTYYSALRRRGLDVDVVGTDADLDGYGAVVAPTLCLADAALADRLRRYAERGGSLLVTMRSGVKDEYDKLRNDPAPGPLAGTVGATLDQRESFPRDEDGLDLTYRGESFAYRTWAEWLDVDGADVVGEYAAGVGEGRAAITRNRVGDGTVLYSGVWPGAELADALVADVLDAGGVECADRLPRDVRCSTRGDAVWVLNFALDPVTVRADGDAEWLVGDEEVPPAGCSVVRAPLSELAFER